MRDNFDFDFWKWSFSIEFNDGDIETVHVGARCI
jgi:hypothetical protein